MLFFTLSLIAQFSAISDAYQCPSDYFEQSGDIPGWGSVNGVGSGRSVSSCDECAQLCSVESGCNSFECSPSDLKCNLNSVADPSQDPYLDYIFCTKDTYQCPSGYFEQSGDIPGWGSVNGVGSGTSVTSCDECAQLCSLQSGCNSFECSPSDLKCNLNSVANPSQGPYLDYRFCTKLPEYGYFSICVVDAGEGETNTNSIEARLTVRATAGEFETSEWKMLGALFGSSSLGTCVDIDVFAADYHLSCWDTLELYTCSADGLAIDTIKYWDCGTWNYVEVPTFREDLNYPQYSPNDCIVSDYIWLTGELSQCYALRIDLSAGYVLMDPPITSGQNCQTYPAKSDGLSLIDEDNVITIRMNDKVMIFGGIFVIFAVLSFCYSMYICLGNKHHKGYKSVHNDQEIAVK